MDILLDDEEIRTATGIRYMDIDREREVAKATGKKIALKLQTIYNLPDEGMFHKKMGEFIQELLECIR